MAVKTEELEDVDISDLFKNKLVVFNDDHNQIDWVIAAFMTVLGMTAPQAEQCTWIIHHKGKYAVKEGSRKSLEPYATALSENWDLTVEIQ